MAQCPSCHKDMAEDFGLVDCPNCGAGLFIEFDGSVRLRDQSGTVAPVSSATQAAVQEPPEYQSFVHPDQNFAGTAPSPDLSDDAMAEAPISFESDEANVEAMPVNPLPDMVLPEPESNDQFMEGLAAFGNSQASNGRDGAYFYDLFISGIDSADLRVEVKEALTDNLFLWDVEALMRKLQLGELQIEHVTSVKAALVVQRLMGLPLKIKWTQHANSEA